MEEIKKVLVQEYPNGVLFTPATLRLLRKKINIEDSQVEFIKREMFQRVADNCWLLPEMIANEKILYDIRSLAEAWLEEFGCFAVEALFNRFERDVHNVSVDDIPGLLRILKFNVPKKRHGDFCFEGEQLHRDILEENVEKFQQILEEAGGILPHHDVQEKMPHLTITSLRSIAKRYMPDLSFILINRVQHWQLRTSITLPENFSENLTTTVERLGTLDINATPESINIALSLLYDENFRIVYGLEDNHIFKNIISEHFSGKVPYRWIHKCFVAEVTR